MATNSNVKTWSYGKGGFVSITFNDGHTESMPEADAIKQGYIQNTGTMGSKGTSTTSTAGVTKGPGSYNSGTTIQDPFGSGASAGSNYTVPVNGVQTPIATLLQATNDPKKLAQIGTQLREIGWIPKGTKSSDAITKAYTSLLVKAASVSMDPNEWLSQWKAAGGGIDTTAAGPSTNISVRTYTPDQIATIADQIYVNKIGRRITPQELKDLADQLTAKEKASPTKTVSNPNAAGTVTTTTTSGGVDEQAFITQQAQKMPEYGRMQNLNFAGWLEKAMTSGPSAAGNLANG